MTALEARLTLIALTKVYRAMESECDPDEKRMEYRYRKGEGNQPDDRPGEIGDDNATN